MNDRANQVITISSALLIGALIGAGVGILTAPRSGEDTRSFLKEKSVEMKGRATGLVQDTRDRAAQALDEFALGLKERIPAVKNQGQHTVAETAQNTMG